VKTRAPIGSVVFACVVLAAAPAFAALSLTLSPNHGTASTTFSARVTYTTKGKCPGTVTLRWDGSFLATTAFPNASNSCTVTRSGLRPLTGHTAAGAHSVSASFSDKFGNHSVSATFTVTKTSTKPTPNPTPTKTATPKPTPSASASAKPSPSASASVSPSASASATPTVSASPSATATAIAAPSTTPSSSLNVPSEGAVHHGNGAFWIILAIMGILVIGPGLWFVLGGNRGTTPPPPAH